MIRSVVKRTGSLKTGRVCLALAFVQTMGETAPDLLQTRAAITSYVRNLHAVRRPLELTRLGKTVSPAKEQHY